MAALWATQLPGPIHTSPEGFELVTLADCRDFLCLNFAKCPSSALCETIDALLRAARQGDQGLVCDAHAQMRAFLHVYGKI